jgi:hypothetical protein
MCTKPHSIHTIKVNTSGGQRAALRSGEFCRETWSSEGRGHAGGACGEEIPCSHWPSHCSLLQYQVGSWDWGKSVCPSGSLVESNCIEQSYSAWHFHADFLVEWGGFWNLQAWKLQQGQSSEFIVNLFTHLNSEGIISLHIFKPNLSEQMFVMLS